MHTYKEQLGRRIAVIRAAILSLGNEARFVIDNETAYRFVMLTADGRAFCHDGCQKEGVFTLEEAEAFILPMAAERGFVSADPALNSEDYSLHLRDLAFTAGLFDASAEDIDSIAAWESQAVPDTSTSLPQAMTPEELQEYRDDLTEIGLFFRWYGWNLRAVVRVGNPVEDRFKITVPGRLLEGVIHIDQRDERGADFNEILSLFMFLEKHMMDHFVTHFESCPSCQQKQACEYMMQQEIELVPQI